MRGLAAAISSACSMPRGVSIMHQTAMPSGAPAACMRASRSRTMPALSTFGSRTASAPEAAAASTSAGPQRLSSGLTRIASSRLP